MDILQPIIMVVGFIGLGIYQHYKIKTLKDQNDAQERLLKNFKIYSEILDPKILKYRLEQHEKLVEKERDIAVKEIQGKFSREMEIKLKKSHDTYTGLSNAFISTTKALAHAMFYITPDTRQKITNNMEDNDTRKAWQGLLPRYQEDDREKRATLLDILTENTKSPKPDDK